MQIQGVLCGVAAMVLSSAVSAFTGDDLISWSKSYEKDPHSERGAAFGAYVAGVTDSGDGIKFCLPKDFTYQQVMTASIKHAFENPVLIPGKASSIIESSMTELYPCK